MPGAVHTHRTTEGQAVREAAAALELSQSGEIRQQMLLRAMDSVNPKRRMWPLESDLVTAVPWQEGGRAFLHKLYFSLWSHLVMRRAKQIPRQNIWGVVRPS